ncbi:MAG: hypothetical protein WDA18_07120 [Candidatus Ratteibacteria bacterium]|jgi:hypothetical protein
MNKFSRKYYHLISLLLAGIIIAFGVACGGGGGGTGQIAAPNLPAGDLYYSDPTGFFTQSYFKVDEHLDNSVIYNQAQNPLWLDGLFFFFTTYAEGGFNLISIPEEEEESPSRLSVAIHPRGMMLSPETWAFFEEDPQNNGYAILSIMEGFSTSGALNSFGGARTVDFSILAGGTYKRVMKPGGEELFQNLYSTLITTIASGSGIPESLVKSLILPESTLRKYTTQLFYNSSYEGGREVGLSEFLELFRNGANWENLDFVVRVRLEDVPIQTIDSVTTSNNRDYSIGSFFIGNQVYTDRVSGSRIYFTSAIENLSGRNTIQTRNADAGVATDPHITISLDYPTDLYVGIDTQLLNNEGVPLWLENWTRTEQLVTTRKGNDPYNTFELFKKTFNAGEVTLPGQGDNRYSMYFVIADSGAYPFGLDVIASAKSGLIENPEEIPFMVPSIRQEGGLVVNQNGIDESVEPRRIHADFIETFDANVFLNTEEVYVCSLENLSHTRFLEQLVRNNGFRLIDTYSDDAPAFDAPSQTIVLEKLLGTSLPSSFQLPLTQESLFSFTNFNQLNSPNLVGIRLSAISTDDPELRDNLWLDTVNNKSLNWKEKIVPAIKSATAFSYKTEKNGPSISLQELLQRAGKNSEGEMSFQANVTLENGYEMILRGSIYCHDYFTDVYDPILRSFNLFNPQ